MSLERAAALAKTNDARLTVIDVTAEVEEAKEVEKRFGIDLNSALREHRLEQLEALTAPHAEAGVMIYTQVLTGISFIEVIRAVQCNGYDLLTKVAKTMHAHKPLILNWFGAKKAFSSGIVGGLNNKVKMTTRKSNGFRTY